MSAGEQALSSEEPQARCASSEQVSCAYSNRAAEYITALGSVGAMHPSDIQLIGSWADGVQGKVLDAGCGPGHWTAHLGVRGIQIHGVDAVPEFISHAQSEFPDGKFSVESIVSLTAQNSSLGGVLSWYSTIHFSPEEIAVPLGEFARVLKPGGTLLLGYFDGDMLAPFNHAVTTAYTWPMRTMTQELESHGFSITETHRRTGPGYRPHAAILCRKDLTDAN